MTGILKVDTIQKNNGATPTAKDLGLNVTGSVLQVVQASTTSEVGLWTSSYADTALSGSIIPLSNTSKILVIANLVSDMYRNNSGVNQYSERIMRDNTSIYETSRGYQGYPTSSNGYWYTALSHNITYLDSPSTTSSITYKVQAKVSNYSGTEPSSQLRYQTSNNYGSATSTIILLEIAG